MDITTRAKAAHLRLLSTLPVRTHTRPEEPPRVYTAAFRARMGQYKRDRVRQMLLAGATYQAIKRALHVGVAMITDERKKMEIPRL